MNWEAVSAIGEIVGAMAVLLTLIYLAVQVKQTRKLQQAEAIRVARSERRDFLRRYAILHTSRKYSRS